MDTMESSKLREIIVDQNQNVSKRGKVIERDISKEIIKSKNQRFIKIISGIRRSGKSTILRQLKEKFGGVYVNFDDERFIHFKVEDFQKLYELSLEIFGKNKYFYFDEIQNVSGWERFVRRISESGENVFVTGSNATMLSKELGTHLTGRFIMFKVYPFSFREFLKLKGEDDSYSSTDEKARIKRLFSKYLVLGGLPEYLETNNTDYLRSLFESILYRDIIVRYKLTSEKALKELIYFAANNLSKEISFNSIKKTLGFGSTTTVSDYFSYMEDTYLFFLLTKYKYSVKKQIQSGKKLYIIDNALSKQLGFSFSGNYGKLLENLVLIELKRRGKEIFYFQENRECDFVIRERGKIKKAIQVCYELSDTNREREVNGLLEAMETFKINEGLILTYDDEEEILLDKKKIVIKPVWKWVLEN